MAIAVSQFESALGEERLDYTETPESFLNLKVVSRDIGELSLVSTGVSRLDQREERLYTINLDGFRRSVSIIEPANGVTPTHNILIGAGFTQMTEKGLMPYFAEHVAKANPDARIAMPQSDGIGSIGDHVTLANFSQHGLKEMAEARHDIAREIFQGEPVVLMGISMGTDINQLVAEHAISINSDEAEGSKKALNIAGIAHVSPALVTPSRVMPDMLVKFIPSLVLDEMKDLPKQLLSSDKEANEHLRALLITAIGHLSLRRLVLEAPALAIQAVGLIGGVTEEAIDRTLASYPHIVIAGRGDPLAQEPMWLERRAARPDQIELSILEGFGHNLPAHPDMVMHTYKKEDYFNLPTAA